MTGYGDHEEFDFAERAPLDLTVYESDPPDIENILYGPRGEVLGLMVSRRQVPFGFQRGGST